MATLETRQSHFTYILKLKTYISSTGIHCKINAKLFVNLEAAAVTKAKGPKYFFFCF